MIKYYGYLPFTDAKITSINHQQQINNTNLKSSTRLGRMKMIKNGKKEWNIYCDFMLFSKQIFSF